MVLTFAELGINAADYNGMDAGTARASVINTMADRITLAQYQHPVTAVETLYDWANGIVDFVKHIINVPPASVDIWSAVNM